MTNKPIRASFPMIDLDIYWDDHMVADVRLWDGRQIHVRNVQLIRQILDDAGLTKRTLKMLES